MLKNGALRLYFITNPVSPYFESDTFRSILEFIQSRTNKARLKQTGRLFMLVVKDTESMEQVLEFLRAMHRFIREN